MNVVAEAQAIDEATEPARWLLASGEGAIGLTQTGALARSVVRDAAEPLAELVKRRAVRSASP